MISLHSNKYNHITSIKQCTTNAMHFEILNSSHDKLIIDTDVTKLTHYLNSVILSNCVKSEKVMEILIVLDRQSSIRYFMAFVKKPIRKFNLLDLLALNKTKEITLFLMQAIDILIIFSKKSIVLQIIDFYMNDDLQVIISDLTLIKVVNTSNNLDYFNSNNTSS